MSDNHEKLGRWVSAQYAVFEMRDGSARDSNEWVWAHVLLRMNLHWIELSEDDSNHGLSAKRRNFNIRRSKVKPNLPWKKSKRAVSTFFELDWRAADGFLPLMRSKESKVGVVSELNGFWEFEVISAKHYYLFRAKDKDLAHAWRQILHSRLTVFEDLQIDTDFHLIEKVQLAPTTTQSPLSARLKRLAPDHNESHKQPALRASALFATEVSEILKPCVLGLKELNDVISTFPFVGYAFRVFGLGLDLAIKMDKENQRSTAVEKYFKELLVCLMDIVRCPNSSKDERWLHNLLDLVAATEKAGCRLELYFFSRTLNKLGTWFHDPSNVPSQIENELEAIERSLGMILKSKNFSMLNEIISMLKDLKSTGADIFEASAIVPSNSRSIVLNFAGGSTFESILKQKLLSPMAGFLGAVTSSTIAGFGMGGVGKTSILRGIGHDKDVLAYFTGGIYWLSFGKDASCQSAIEQVALAIANANGSALAQQVREIRKIDQAMAKAGTWFKDRRCLFLCDDLWSNEVSSTGYAAELKELVEGGDGSCMVFSTRDHKIVTLVQPEHKVELTPLVPDGSRSKCILCRHAGFGEEEIQQSSVDVGNSFKDVLLKCAGLPLALAVAGSAVFNLAAMSLSPENRLQAWEQFSKRLNNVFERCGEIFDEATDKHPGLTLAMHASLEAANVLADKNRYYKIRNVLSHQKLHRSLCIVQKQSSTPIAVLARMWGMSCTTARRIVEDFAGLSLLDVSGEGTSGCISLHDLVHDFCIMEAGIANEIEEWHFKVLNGYISRSTCGSRLVVGAREWWSPDVEFDRYIHANLSRHLIESGQATELENLLLDIRWGYRQIEVNGLWTLEKDFESLIRQLKPKRDMVEKKHIISYEMILKALQLSRYCLPRNPRELAFQMCGRLNELRKKFSEINVYLESAERYAKRPFCRLWTHPLGQCLTPPGGALIATVNTEFSVSCVATTQKSRIIVAGGDNCKLQVVNIKNHNILYDLAGHTERVTCAAVDSHGKFLISGSLDNTLRIWSLETGCTVGEPLRGHDSGVSSVAVSLDEDLIVSGSHDRTLRIWNIKTGKAVGNSLRGHSSGVWSVAASRDGEFIVSGSEDKTIRIWSAKTGKTIGNPLCGHCSGVRSVAVSPNGKHIVSGSEDNTIRIWNLATGDAIGKPLHGHHGRVLSVAVSPDGKRIVSGSGDSTLRIWSMRTGDTIGHPLCGHSYPVCSVVVTPDGKRIISASPDKTIRIWTMEVGDAAEQLVHGHKDANWSSAVSPDGKLVVCGSSDNTLRIWSMDTGSTIGEPLRGHENWVWAVAISPNGKRIVSGSRDKTVRIWSMETRDAIGEPLRDHQGVVWSVVVSPDGERIVSCSDDKTVRVWHAISGRCERVIKTGGEWLSKVDLLQVAFGDATTRNLRDMGNLKRVFCKDCRIFYKTNDKSVVLATFQHPVSGWHFSAGDQRLCVSLWDGSVAFVDIIE